MSLHHLFMCPEEVNDSMPIHQISGQTIIDAQVPGYLPKKQRTIGKGKKVAKVRKVLVEDARTNADAAITWALRLHDSGKSLNGKFEATDLRKDPCNKVKCAAAKRVLLKKATTKRKKNDLKKIGKIIKHDILKVQSEDDIPCDLKHLLVLLKSYEAGYEILIANHPGLKNEDGKIDLFNRLFAQLEFLMVTDPSKYLNIIASMPYGNNFWRPFANCNKYVYAVYTFRNGTAKYLDSSEGAIYLYRNCFQHLIKDHSTIRQVGKPPVVLFIYKQMEHMLATVLPGVTVELMVALYKESALSNVF